MEPMKERMQFIQMTYDDLVSVTSLLCEVECKVCLNEHLLYWHAKALVSFGLEISINLISIQYIGQMVHTP